VVGKFVFMSNLAVQLNVDANFSGAITIATLTKIMNIKRIKIIY